MAESDEEAEEESRQESPPKAAGPLDRLSQLQHHQLAVLLDTAMLKVNFWPELMAHYAPLMWC